MIVTVKPIIEVHVDEYLSLVFLFYRKYYVFKDKHVYTTTGYFKNSFQMFVTPKIRTFTRTENRAQ